jgi:hypothetical protein
MPTVEHSDRARPVQIPAPTRAAERALEERQAYLAERRRLQLRSLVRGLIMLALVVLAVSIVRAGLGRVFPPNWWRP